MPDDDRGSKSPPTQATLPQAQRLKARAEAAAREQVVSQAPGNAPVLMAFLDQQQALLRDAYEHFVEVSETELAISYAGEWILDNFYIIQQTLRQVREDLPMSYYRELPVLAKTPLAGYPRIYALTREVVRYCRNRPDMDRMRRFLQIYQQMVPLTMGELWAFPIMLRIVILENLTQALHTIAELEEDYSPQELFACRPLRQEISDDEIVANGILSLHAFLNQDWSAFFEDVDPVDRVLAKDPAAVYSQMDFDTRDLYRKVIEEISLGTDQTQESIAQEAVRLAEEASSARKGQDRSADRAAGEPIYSRLIHVGYYLLDKGRSELEARVHYRPSPGVRLRRWLLSHAEGVYVGAIGLFTVLLVLAAILYAWAAGGTVGQWIAVALLTLVPAVTVAVDLVNWLVIRLVPPRLLPKLDLTEGVPPEYTTMVVIPTLLTSESEVDFLLQQLELHYLSNSDPHLYFALLTDWADAPEKDMPEDGALVQRARAGVEALNQRYSRRESAVRAVGDPFFLFHRERQWNPGEAVWMGWERKRGKLAEFNQLLLGHRETSFIVTVGDMNVLPRIRYVITLDTDTSPAREAAQRLIGTLAHPLNRALFDPETRQVVAGYTVLQPRTELKPTSANQSLFAQIFSGDRGMDLYSRAVSDVYQDLFGEGIYVGKGIYDVAAFEYSLHNVIPENALLSHDLFEGIHGRAGLVTDVIFYEDYPPHYLAYSHRTHRWLRGDWQIAPWLLPKVPHATQGWVKNRLSLIDRWKILDNLRRSLLMPWLLALFTVGWLWLPGSAAVWMLVGVLATSIPLVVDVVTAVTDSLAGRGLLRDNLVAQRDSLLRWLLRLAFLPHQALIAVDAIFTALTRMVITRRHLLQWQTAAHTVRLFGRQVQVRVVWMQMGGASLVALGVGLMVGLLAPGALPAALPLLLLWLISPQLAYWISQPLDFPEEKLLPEQHAELRRLVRRTWLYFERFIGPDDHWLPPDHYQENPLGTVAHRTSPTNIGVALLTTLGAYDLGYIDVLELAVRLRDTFGEMDRLDRYRGHFLNWYDTRTLEPLTPRYVSTVDSGNLAACLVVLAQACVEIPQDPILRWDFWLGLLDTMDVFWESLGQLNTADLRQTEALREAMDQVRQRVLAARDDPACWVRLLGELEETIWRAFDEQVMGFIESESRKLGAEALSELSVWTERLEHHLASARRVIDALLPWCNVLLHPPALLAEPGESDTAGRASIVEQYRELQRVLQGLPRLGEVSELATKGLAQVGQLRQALQRMQTGPGVDDAPVREALAWCDRLEERIDSGRIGASSLLIAYQDVRLHANRFFDEMDFGFLFDPQRKIFRIGYNVMAERPDNSFYDLLASEARLTSLLAIAKGQVPQEHWLHISRPLTRVDGRRALLSWSGTMFEYLMPPLLAETYRGTLLEQSCQAAITRQIEYAHGRGVPWGISESGFYQFDANQAYQYRAFGVPGLGLKRGLGDDLVIAPYASLLALTFRPQAVLQNLDRLRALGMLGQYGLYEAADYTRSRLALGQTYARVRSYMVHHQGMIFLSLVNALQDAVMVRRFHDDPRIKSVDLLLHEQMPQKTPLQDLSEGRVSGLTRAEPEVSLTPWSVPVDAPLPQAHLISNGRYTLVITAAGSGYSHCALEGETVRSSSPDTALTRWRADTTRENWGTWLYLRDEETGDLWSATYQPTAVEPEMQEVWFDPYRAEFHRHDHEIVLRTEITVSPEDNVEVRRVTVTNQSDRPRRLTLTSYAEVVLSGHQADRRHQAFNKLFVESEYLPAVNMLLFRRRPRSGEEPPFFLGHLMLVEAGQQVTGAYETDRARFLGRGHTVRFPAVLSRAEYDLSGTTGATLDPVMVLGQQIDLAPHTSQEVALVTLAASSRDAALALARRYRLWESISRTFHQARSQSMLALRDFDLDVADVRQTDRLFSALIYPHRGLRADADTLAANTKGQPGLWAYGISGDYPILLVRLNDAQEIDLVGDVLQAHAYWRSRRVQIDLVFLNQRETGYGQELQGLLRRLVVRSGGDPWLNQRGGIFMLRADQMSEADRRLLATAARVVLDGDRGSLADQLERLSSRPVPLPAFVPVMIDYSVEPTPPLEPVEGLQFDNGYGGFGPDGREYVVDMDPEVWTPAPWINVIANAEFGFLVSTSGMGYSWAVNSGENRLSEWRNDPVSETPAEAVYLRDEETAEIWSPTPLPARAPAPYRVRHGAGYSIFEHHSHGLKQRLRLFASRDDPVKVMQLRLENVWSRGRRITVTYYVPWVLGTTHYVTQQYIIPEYDANAQALLARNPYNVEFGERVAFVTASQAPHGLSTDRTEFLGRLGDLAHPEALDRVGLSGRVEPGLDPCAALQIHVDLAPGEVKEIHFVLGQGANRREALELAARYRDPAEASHAWEQAAAFWDDLLSTVAVDTPDEGMNLLLNRWLLYQALACRFWGRSALYQSSGAYGFRDQLQDVMALVHAAPHLTREHIRRSARHQFEAGDVLHWWHPPSGRGVRTRITDDLLWLPYVTAFYVNATGDESVLDAEEPFLVGEPLKPEEEERYGHYAHTADQFTIYEHCRRAMDRGTTAGPHGLPLIGAGDWNDGMNRVGIKGRGESIWLGWFLYGNLTSLADLCARRGDEEMAVRYRERARSLQNALEANAWDGDWYRRAYYDDGTPLGSAKNLECQIDSIAQSWGVLSGGAEPERAARAMASVLERLVREEDELLLLFTPPFNQTLHDPGYIKGYPPGIRENGGQYTHAALWAVWAFAEMGHGERAEALFRMLNPIYHALDRKQAERYLVEPYVVAADVYSVPPHTGHGGWTWYTGSSGWMYRLGVERILGVQRVGRALRVDPRIPGSWPSFSITYRAGQTVYRIQVENPKGVEQGVSEVTLDGEPLTEMLIPLSDDGGEHAVRVRMG